MINYLKEFCERYEYGKDAINDLCITLEAVKSGTLFNSAIDILMDSSNTDYMNYISILDKISTDNCLNKYTLYLLFYIIASKNLKDVYILNKLPLEIFYDSMADLKYKLNECKTLTGINGITVAPWFYNYYRLRLFSLGRMQYETAIYKDGGFSKYKCELNGTILEENTPVVFCHIPSSGMPFNKEERLKSYKKAYEFFNKYSDILYNYYSNTYTGNLIILCHSWLLYPKHTEFLPAEGNICSFMNDFKILGYEEDNSYNDLWRIFGKSFDGNIDALDTNTSLKKAYKSWLKQGNLPGCGYGALMFDGTNIINK